MKKKNEFDKLGIQIEITYINPLGIISWKNRELVSSLMSVSQLELPKDLYKYIDFNRKDDE